MAELPDEVGGDIPMHTKRALGRGVGLGASLFAFLITAGPPSLAKAPPPRAAAAPAAGSETMQVQGTLGELDSDKVEKLFAQHQADFRRCYDEVAASQHYVGGHMELKVAVLLSGQPRAVTVVDSNLGSIDIERCIAGQIAKLRFPAPKGGEGEVSYPFDCTARTPVGNWPSERIAAALYKKRSALKSCKGKGGAAQVADLHATLYVGPGGKATSIGFSAAAPIDEKLTTCVAKQILSLQYDDPLGQMVKVSYDLKDLLGPPR